MAVRSTWLLAFLFAAACGGSDSNPTSPDAAPLTPIEVNVYTAVDTKAPAAGIDVVFGDASGALVLAMKTDAEGKATVDGMPSVTMVTLLGLNPDMTHHFVMTTFGVKPGDTLHSFLPYGGGPPPSPSPASLYVSYPANPPAGPRASRST